jgi:dihydroorotate dehydrogenase electron transfer subunit
MVLKLNGFKGAIKPGQFFHIRPGSGYDPLLRRPISVHRIGSEPNIIEIMYKVLGKGTALLSRRSKATSLDVIGPLGNGFKISKDKSDFILVAGGMGVAPLVALADELARFRKESITVVLGARTKSHIACDKEFKELGIKTIIITEDGSEGVKGLATDILEVCIEQFDVRKTKRRLIKKERTNITIGDYYPQLSIYACGPTPMLKAISTIAARYRIQAQASLEERMGCGIGACLGCAVLTKQGYKRVCKDGPVFNLDDIIWK